MIERQPTQNLPMNSFFEIFKEIQISANLPLRIDRGMEKKLWDLIYGCSEKDNLARKRCKFHVSISHVSFFCFLKKIRSELFDV